MKTIGVFAPSSYIEKTDIEAAANNARQAGFDVFIHPQTYLRHQQSAGTSAEKINALYDLYENEDIDIIWAAGGGNRSLHYIDDINYARIANHPKPLIGFSDVTALLNAITVKTGIKTIHGPVFKNLATATFDENLKNYLSSGAPFQTMPMTDCQILNHGVGVGAVFGGNLSIFQYLPQTLNKDFTNGAILLLEDCNEELSRIDRMFLHLKRTGALDKVTGLVFGQFTDLADSARAYGFTLEDIIKEQTSGLNIPIVMNASFGHIKNNHPFLIGVKMHLNTEKKIFQLI